MVLFILAAFTVTLTVFLYFERITMSETISKLAATVAANTAATVAAVERIGAITPPSGVDETVVLDAITAIEANTALLNAAILGTAPPALVETAPASTGKGVSFGG